MPRYFSICSVVDVMDKWYFIRKLWIQSLYFFFSFFAVPLQPSRRRSLFNLATAMIIFLSKAYNIIPLIPSAKSALTNDTVGATECVSLFYFLFIVFSLVLYIP